MNKTILTGVIAVLVAVIGVMVFTNDGKEKVTNDVSTTSDQIVDGAENTSRNWKTFGPSQEFSREFTFQIPQKWEAFLGVGSAETASVDFVLQSEADFSGNYPPAGGAVAQAELALQGESLINRFQDNSRVTQEGSEQVTVNGYEGSVHEWTIRDGELTTQLDGYLAEGETSRKFKVLYLPNIGNEETFTLMIDSDIADAERLFEIITNSIDFQ
jgi:hypothetical protein